jgi:predicted ATPase/DNA-binding CsgD family transcriptional regulator
MSDPTPIVRTGLVPLASPSRKESSPLARLPTPVTSLIGREREAAEVVTLLRRPEIRLVTLTGPGGVGKTRLSIEVARVARGEFSGGVAFVTLDAIRDPLHVGPTILQAFGLQVSGDGLVEDRLAAALRDAPFLLVLDNFEQVTEAALLPRDLLARCPELKVLITSREPLHIDGEREFAVPPLSLPPACREENLLNAAAVRLFVERAVEPGLLLNEASATAVVEICRRLDGLPLAIELAAARTKILPPTALLARLERRLPLLTSVARDRPARFRTMRDAIAWSYELLTSAEQAFFRRLAVFAGGFTLEGAEAISRGLSDEQTDSSALDAVAALIDKSLLVRRSAQEDEPRFGMLETIREFGLEQLTESGDAEETYGRHAAYCLAVARWAQSAYWGRLPPVGGGGPEGQRGGKSGDWRRRLTAELENFRAALTWSLDQGEIETALQLGCALEPLWWILGHHAEGRQWLEQALAVAGDDAPSGPAGHLPLVGGVSPALRVEALRLAGLAAAAQSDYAGAVALAEEGRTLAQQHCDLVGVARVTFVLGLAAVHEGYMDIARAHLEDALARFRKLDDRGWEGWTLCYQTSVTHLDLLTEPADPVAMEQAECKLEKALTLFQEMGHMPGVARAVHGLSYHASRQGDYARAMMLAHETIRLRFDLGQFWSLPVSFGEVADIALATGQAEQAAWLYGAAEIQREVQGTPFETAWRTEHERRIQAVRDALNPQDFAATWAAGRALSFEEAVAGALAVRVDSRAASDGPNGSLSMPEHVVPGRLDGRDAAGLSPREREILLRIAAGQTNQEIATNLSLSIRTVNNHVTAILEKLGQPSRAAAVAVAIRRHLI